MLAHHRATLDRAIEFFAGDGQTRAVILAGSIAKGLERPDSDVDLVLVVTDEAFARRRQTRRLSEVFRHLSTYEGGYVDVKFLSVGAIERVATHGSEPMRHSFTGTRRVWGEPESLDALLPSLPVYPEHERAERIGKFYSQMMLQRYFVGQADQLKMPLLMQRAASEAAFFSGRTLLAWNRRLFPCGKRLVETLGTCPDLPEGYLTLLDEVTRHPEAENVMGLMNLVSGFQNWEAEFGLDWGQILGIYTDENEMRWLEDRPALADW